MAGIMLGENDSIGSSKGSTLGPAKCLARLDLGGEQDPEEDKEDKGERLLRWNSSALLSAPEKLSND